MLCESSQFVLKIQTPSSNNLKKMRIFYEEWQCLSIGSPMANQLQQLENKIEEGVEIGEKALFCINR